MDGNMKATTARRKTRRVQSKKQKETMDKYKIEQELQKKEIRRALKEDYPKILRKVQSAIRLAIKEGYEATNFDYNCHWEIIDKIIEKLRKDGYDVNRGHSSEDSNMGDFNAPCFIHESRYWLEISWKDDYV